MAAAETAETSLGRRLPSLTGMRFVAAALVFAFHASLEGFFGDPAVQSGVSALFGKAGWTGVSFFFVLSGFVLAWSARPGDRARHFWRRRIAKIYPGHLVTALLAFALLAAAGTATAIGPAVANLLLVQSFFPQPEIFVSGNPVSWSLSCELFFYLSFPLLWRGLSRIPARRLWAWAAAVTAVVVVVIPTVAGLLPAEPVLAMPDGTPGRWQYWFLYVLPPVRALEFVLGVLLARIVREGRWSGPRPRPAAALLVVGYVLATQVPYLHSLVAATLVPTGLLIAALAHADVTGRRTRCAGLCRLLVRLGELSFALYLVHRLVLMYGHQLLGPTRTWSTPVAVLLIGAGFAVSLLLADVLHRTVERPAMRRFGGKRPAPQPQAQPQTATSATCPGETKCVAHPGPAENAEFSAGTTTAGTTGVKNERPPGN